MKSTRNWKNIIRMAQFPHPWWYPYSGVGPQPKSVNEWHIIELSKAIRSKPDWQTKYKNEEIVSKWRKESVDQIESEEKEEIFDYTLRELEWYDKLSEGIKDYKIECDDKIISGNPIPDAIKKELFDEVSKYSKLMEKDYHPGSNNQVVDIVHPSLFPLQYGKTPIVKGEGYEIIQFDESIFKVKKMVDSWGISKNYQWLPSLWTLEKDQFKISSYINNLHPKNKSLYEAIEKVFNHSVDGLNYVLSRYQSPELLRIDYGGYGEGYTEEVDKKFEELQEKIDKLEEETGEVDWDLYDEFEEEIRGQYLKKLIPKYEQDPVTEPFNLKDYTNLKVIVKLADIELTPENPIYKGGSWHVEGTINEDIVATVLYYYDMENITESRLSFRTSFQDPPYDQNDSLYCDKLFGLHDGDPMIKDLGFVTATEGKTIIFPNSFQHHVGHFQLKDETKPGVRRILCFFLVDPNNEIVKTTKDIPPQQQDWWNDKDLDLIPDSVRSKEKPMTLDEAKEVRKKLMEERSALEADDDNMQPYLRGFSLCEH